MIRANKQGLNIVTIISSVLMNTAYGGFCGIKILDYMPQTKKYFRLSNILLIL
jgi:hypothetical protein